MKNNCLTTHARKRMQQRAISKTQVALIEMFGEERYQKGGTYTNKISNKVLNELKHAIDKLQGIQIISNETGTIITTMHETRRTNTTDYIV